MVLDTPPGIVRRSSSSVRSDGSGIACSRCTSSATGAALSTSCPVGAREPSEKPLRTRISTGSTPTAAASLSMTASIAKAVCTEPKPRIAPQGGLLV